MSSYIAFHPINSFVNRRLNESKLPLACLSDSSFCGSYMLADSECSLNSGLPGCLLLRNNTLGKTRGDLR